MKLTPTWQHHLTRLITLLFILSLPAVPLAWLLWYRDGGGFEAIYVAVVAIPAGLWAARRWLEGRDTAAETTQLSPEALQNPRNRENLLNSVHTAWIEGVLHQSIHGEIIKLYLAHKPDAVGMRFWGLALKQAGKDDQSLPADYDLHQIFAKSGRNLLILGQPGSGKTFTLLQLAEPLIAAARRNPTDPLPVILNLSSWAQDQKPLADWLAEELFMQYGVARRVTRAGITNNQFFYLLDGLDEVAADARGSCVTAINDFKAEHPAEMVICSRSEEYGALPEQLRMGTAVEIQPLTPDQIDHYLSQEGLQLDAVRTTLRTDPDLRELAQTPLMLSIMTLAYQGEEKIDLRPRAGKETRRRHIFDHYIAKNFARRSLPADSPYTQEQATTWLSNLARGMVQHEQSVFNIEKLQPTWLSLRSILRYRLYIKLATAVIFGLTGSLIIGLVASLVHSLVFGLGVGLLALLLYGLAGWRYSIPVMSIELTVTFPHFYGHSVKAN
jgi:eukaryotic-like serine/threonine-protein kinase